jgi:hypothetical protein
MQLRGFPLRLDLLCERAAFTGEGANANASAELAGLNASAPLYWPGYVEATLGSPFVANLPALGLGVTTTWSAATTTTSAGPGGLSGASADFRTLDFTTNGAALIPVRAVKADRAAASAAPASGNAYTFTAAADQLAVVPNDGRVIPPVSGEARVTALDFGSTLGKDPKEKVLAWLRAGGSANVEKLRFVVGETSVDASGTVSVSSEGLLSGNLILRLRNPDGLADFVEAIRPGSRDQMTQVLGVLNALTAPVETPEGPARQTTLVLKNGLAMIGILPVGFIPALKF